ncbi:hypothetical protein ACWFQ8_08415 [Streptomyces sp. NPDC055254]
MSVRTAAAVAVVAGVVTTLLPLSATSAAAAPATDGHAFLRTEMSTPVPNGPLTRGGATQTFDLTVNNPTDRALTYKPWMLVDTTGPSPLEEKDIVYEVDAVNAPATTYSVGGQDGGWQGHFYPAQAADEDQRGFDIPAKGKMSWKITVGLGANYPTNNGDFSFTAGSYNNSVAPDGDDSHVFEVGPRIKAGTLKTWFTQGPGDMGGQERRAYQNLNWQATGDGAFDKPLAPTVTVSHPGTEDADFRVQGNFDGSWRDLPLDDGRVRLPEIPGGFGAAKGVRTAELRVSLGNKTQLKKRTTVTLTADVSLAHGNTWPIVTEDVSFPLVPSADPEPSTAPSTPPSTAPTSPSAAATTKAPSVPAVRPAAATSSAAAAGTAPAGTTNGSASGSLASTGSDSATGRYAVLGAALVVIGAAAAWIGSRRRRGATA